MPLKLRPTPTFRNLASMPSLTLREQVLILAVLAAVLVGVAVKHWRDARRDAPAAVAGHPAPAEF